MAVTSAGKQIFALVLPEAACLCCLHNPVAACIILGRIPCDRLLTAPTAISNLMGMQLGCIGCVLEFEHCATCHLSRHRGLA